MRVASTFLILTLLQIDQAAAATNISCVGSADELTSALSSLSNSPSNTDSDEIRIRAGLYFAPAGGWVGSVTTNHDLAIHGGYADAGCIQQTNDASITM